VTTLRVATEGSGSPAPVNARRRAFRTLHEADSVARCVATGVAGLSIEDATGDPSSPLYELTLALERVRAARQAIDQSGADILLTARAECYLVGHPDPLPESVRRLQAYASRIRRRSRRSPRRFGRSRSTSWWWSGTQA
jgi:Phosphoenolpyruvate phosphomutase